MDKQYSPVCSVHGGLERASAKGNLSRRLLFLFPGSPWRTPLEWNDEKKKRLRKDKDHVCERTCCVWACQRVGSFPSGLWNRTGVSRGDNYAPARFTVKPREMNEHWTTAARKCNHKGTFVFIKNIERKSRVWWLSCTCHLRRFDVISHFPLFSVCLSYFT